LQILLCLFAFSFTNSTESIPVRDTVIIDSVPFIEWTYGSTQTATAMVLWYWDYRNYGRLVDFFFDPYDSLYSNLPNVIKELNDTSLIYVTNGINGYNFQSQTSPHGGAWNQWQFSWIKNEIDNGRPCIWYNFDYWYSGSFINHSCCAIGYIIAPPDTFIVVHDTWNNTRQIWPLWTYHQGLYSYDYVLTIVPGGTNPDNIFITYPSDSDLVFQYGDTVNITWDLYGNEINYVKIWYASTYDFLEWTLIDSCAPNTGIYTWIVPDESLCARINLQAFNASDILEAADGSFYNFIIQPTGIAEQGVNPIKCNYSGATIFSGPIFLPEDKTCRVFDITGCVVAPDKIKPGIYFIEIDGVIAKKVVKVR